MTARSRPGVREVLIDLVFAGWAMSGLVLSPFLWVAAKAADGFDRLVGRRAADWGKR